MHRSLLIAPLVWIGRLFDRVFFLIGAVVFAQVPGFIAHYRQRLGGHLDEARRDLANYQRMADELADGSLNNLIQQFLQSADTRMVRTGELITDKIDRVQYLQDAAEALANASVWTKPYQFLSHFDSEIAARAFEQYEMNVPTTMEGLLYALVGAVVVSLLVHGLARTGAKGGRRLAQRLRRSDSPPPEAAANSEEVGAA